jgi:hypothetical protein
MKIEAEERKTTQQITNYIWNRHIDMMMDVHDDDDDDGLVHTELVSERPNSSPQSSKAPFMKS